MDLEQIFFIDRTKDDPSLHLTTEMGLASETLCTSNIPETTDISVVNFTMLSVILTTQNLMLRLSNNKREGIWKKTVEVISQHLRRCLRKTAKKLRTTGVPVEIQIQYLMNISLDRYRCSNRLRPR
jgi:hypothetical protein